MAEITATYEFWEHNGNAPHCVILRDGDEMELTFCYSDRGIAAVAQVRLVERWDAALKKLIDETSKEHATKETFIEAHNAALAILEGA